MNDQFQQLKLKNGQIQVVRAALGILLMPSMPGLSKHKAFKIALEVNTAARVPHPV